jgi:hypothetical protein
VTLFADLPIIVLQEELQAKEDNITALLDDMYAQVAKTRLIRNETERQILLREISAANDSVQLFFTVSRNSPHLPVITV